MVRYSELTPEWAAELAPMALLANNAYRRNTKPFPLEPLGWRHVTMDDVRRAQPAAATAAPAIPDPTFDDQRTGMAYDLFRHTDGHFALAFRGTDDARDWLRTNIAIGFSRHYRQAFDRFKSLQTTLMNVYGKPIAFVTGHSLGGGLALGASTRFGVPAYVFNPSPRIFDGWGDHHQPATRIAVYQNGDPLRFFWWLGGKVYAAVGDRRNIHRADFDYTPLFARRYPVISALANNHYMNNLAIGLLSLGRQVDPRLQAILDEMRIAPIGLRGGRPGSA
jgi:hypothetical protein